MIGKTGRCFAVYFNRGFCCNAGGERRRRRVDLSKVQDESHTSHVAHRTSHVTRHSSHVASHTLHVTRHTSHVTRHTLSKSSKPHEDPGYQTPSPSPCRHQLNRKSDFCQNKIKSQFISAITDVTATAARMPHGKYYCECLSLFADRHCTHLVHPRPTS